MEEKKSNRGGRREGAGRKRDEVAKSYVALRFSPDIIAYLRTKGRGQSAYIEALIRQDRQRNER